MVERSKDNDGKGSTGTAESASAVTEGYSGRQAAEIVGITYRQLDYWARTNLVRPTLADAHGSGSRRKYSYRDLLELKVIKSLLDAGIALESVRNVFKFLRERLGEDVASAHLVIDGTSAMLVRDEELIDLVKGGQGVLNLLSLDSVKAALDTVIELDGARSGNDPQSRRAERRRAASNA